MFERDLEEFGGGGGGGVETVSYHHSLVSDF